MVFTRAKIKKRKVEKWGLVLTSMFGVMLFILANMLLVEGKDDIVHISSSIIIPTITMFWVALSFFHIGLIFLVVRSVVKDREKDFKDGVAGFIGILGLIFILLATIGGAYFQLTSVEWMFHLNPSIIFNLGFVMEMLVLCYFAFTE